MSTLSAIRTAFRKASKFGNLSTLSVWSLPCYAILASVTTVMIILYGVAAFRTDVPVDGEYVDINRWLMDGIIPAAGCFNAADCGEWCIDLARSPSGNNEGCLSVFQPPVHDSRIILFGRTVNVIHSLFLLQKVYI
jgi:hypothetical protein